MIRKSFICYSLVFITTVMSYNSMGSPSKNPIFIDITGGVFPLENTITESLDSNVKIVINTKFYLRVFYSDYVLFMEKSSKKRMGNRKLRDYELHRVNLLSKTDSIFSIRTLHDELSAYKTIKNYCYALHGKVFRSDSIQSQLNTEGWYVSNQKYSDQLLDEIDWIEIDHAKNQVKKINDSFASFKNILKKFDNTLAPLPRIYVLKMDSSNFAVSNMRIWLKEDSLPALFKKPQIFNLIYDDHFGDKPAKQYYVDGLDVICYHDKVIGVTTVNPKFATQNNIHVGMSLKELLKKASPVDEEKIPSNCVIRLSCTNEWGYLSYFFILLINEKISMMLLES